MTGQRAYIEEAREEARKQRAGDGQSASGAEIAASIEAARRTARRQLEAALIVDGVRPDDLEATINAMMEAR